MIVAATFHEPALRSLNGERLPGWIVARCDDGFTAILPSNGGELLEDKPMLETVVDELRATFSGTLSAPYRDAIRSALKVDHPALKVRDQ